MLVRPWWHRVLLRISLNDVLSALNPIVKAAVRQYAGHVFIVEYENPFAQDADSLPTS